MPPPDPADQTPQPDPLFRAIVESCPDAVLVADDHGQYTIVNAAATELTGFSRTQLQALSVWDLTPQPNQTAGLQLWQRFLEAGRQDGEYELVRRDGSTVPVEYRAVARVRPGLHFVFLRDVTSRRLVEQALRLSEARFRLMADSAPVLIWMADGHTKGTYFNQRWAEFTGQSAEGSRGDGWLQAIHPDDASAAAACRRRHAEARQPFTIEFRLRRADGAFRWMLDTGVPLTDDSGVLRGYIGSCVDIEDRKRAELQIEALFRSEQEARAAAEAANRAKDDFLATLSHELRTPLNVVLGYTRMLLEGEIPPGRLTPVFESLERNARAQLRLVSDLLDVSSASSGKMVLERSVVDARALVEAVHESMLPAAAARNVTCRIDGSPPGAALVFADEGRFGQTVGNLLANAIKFTPPGGRVDTTVHRTAESQVCIEVRDTGVGIDPSFLPHVFDRFRQADGSPTRSTGGLGIGLTIVRQIVELHGGRVQASSAGLGHGATFTVWLPAAATST